MSVPPSPHPSTEHPPRPGPGPGSAGAQPGPGWWDEVYSERRGWDIDRPQPVFSSLVESGEVRGKVLDVGCGTGEHVLLCAASGLDATGVDLSATALATARAKAHARGLQARFLHQDVATLRELGEAVFDTVLDCGLFVHVVDDDRLRTAYLEGVAAVLRPGGRYFMVCFRSPEDQHAAAAHHRPSSRDEIAEQFAGRWQIDGVDPVTLDSVDAAARVPAWRVAGTRTDVAARPRGVDEPASC